jgi:tetratricopeptide (TPR) repeat protein
MRSSFLISILCLPLLSGCNQGPVAWWESVNGKARHLLQLEADYSALKKSHEKLESDFFHLEAQYTELRSRTESREAGEHNLAATGSLTGRSPASIAYKVPAGLKPEEMLNLAFEHFGEKRFAEAAVTFETLLKQPESATVTDAVTVYTAGVSWFQVGNYHRAKERLEEARNTATGDQRQKIQKKVELWMRVIDRKLASEGEAKAAEQVSGEGPAEGQGEGTAQSPHLGGHLGE